MPPANPVVVVAAQSARVVAGARRKKRSGTRRPIFGHLSRQQQAAVKESKERGAVAIINNNNNTKDASSSSEHLSPVSVLDQEVLVSSQPRSVVVPSSVDHPMTSDQQQANANQETSSAMTDDAAAVAIDANKSIQSLPPLTLPSVAWQVHQSFTQEVARRHWVVTCYHATIIVASTAAVSMAVWYAHFYATAAAAATNHGFPRLHHHAAVVIFGLTIALPVAVTFLVPRLTKFQQAHPLVTAQRAVAQWQASVYTFRTTAGAAGNAATTTPDDEKVQQAELARRQALAKALQTEAQTIWNATLPMVVERTFPSDVSLWMPDCNVDNSHKSLPTHGGGLVHAGAAVPYGSVDNPGEVNVSNASSCTTVHEQEPMLLPPEQQHPSHRPSTQWEEELPCCIIPTTTTTFNTKTPQNTPTETKTQNSPETSYLHLPFVRDLEEAATPTETTPMLPKPRSSSSLAGNQGHDNTQFSQVDNQTKDNKGSLQNEEIKIKEDDKHSMLTLDDYVNLRLKLMLQDKTRHVASLQAWHTALKRSIALVTASASLVALLAQQWIIPIILAVASAGTSTLEASSLVHQVDRQAKCVAELQQLLEEWESQEADDEETGNQRDDMVQKVEAVLVEAVG